MREPAVKIRCRKEDLHLVYVVLESACEIYVNKVNVVVPNVIVDDKVFLPSSPQVGASGSTWYKSTFFTTVVGFVN